MKDKYYRRGRNISQRLIYPSNKKDKMLKMKGRANYDPAFNLEGLDILSILYVSKLYYINGH
jgi:hypothetical protein